MLTINKLKADMHALRYSLLTTTQSSSVRIADENKREKQLLNMNYTHNVKNINKIRKTILEKTHFY